MQIDPDPRPGQSFYERSDNIAFARIGIPAHTLSSFGLHPDYHSPDDEVERIDFEHLETVIGVAVEAVRGPRKRARIGVESGRAPLTRSLLRPEIQTTS